MIRLLLCGIWVCLVTLGSTYAAVSWKSAAIADHEEGKEAGGTGIKRLTTRSFSVPVIADGAVQGYVVAQFTYIVDNDALNKLGVKPESYIVDEAFRTIYTGDEINFRKMKKQDLPHLSKLIGENVNKRVGLQLVQEVLIEQLSYIPKGKVRGRNLARE
jgi:hypothetical protein